MSDISVQLEEVMARKGYSQSHIARSIGRSPAAISTFLSGKYSGDVKALQSELISFIQRESDKDRLHHLKIDFVPTITAKSGLEVMRMAHLENDINIIYGAAGLGKTMMLKEYARRYRDAILIETDPGYTALVLLQELCDCLGLNKRGTIHELSESCIAALSGTGRVVLIDEAENLPYRALEVMRRIHDKAGVGVVLAGMPRLLLNLKGKRGEYAQLYSRIGFRLDLQDTLPQADLQQILTSMVEEASNDTVFSAFYKASKGNARRLFKLARGTIRASEINESPIDEKMVNKVAGMLIS